MSRSARSRAVGSWLPQDVQGVADRGQGVAQLVGEHGQELVLAPVRLLERLGEFVQADSAHLALGGVAHRPRCGRGTALVEFAHGQVHRKGGLVLAPAHHLALPTRIFGWPVRR